MPCTSYCKCKADKQYANDNVKLIGQCDNSEQDCGEEGDSDTEGKCMSSDHDEWSFELLLIGI